MTYVENYFDEVTKIVKLLNTSEIEKLAGQLAKLRDDGGRLFFIGVGGSAANASHAVNDFRKLCAIEAYAPTDNVSELTARVNDDGWETAYVNWLKISNINKNDMIFVFSVGGGNEEKNISLNIVKSLQLAKEIGAKVCGVVGRDGGYTAQVADACVIIPSFNSETVTSQTEGFQAVVWHLIVSHPKLKKFEMKWESVK